MIRKRLGIGALLVVLAVASGLMFAANQAAAQSTPTPDQINAVAKELWCPLCNGVRLDNCELQACVQMREEIGQKLAAGQSRDQIKTYFVQRYGDVVLGMPSNKGVNLVIWVLPILIGVLALGWVSYYVVVWVRRRPAPGRAAASPPDDYLQRVDEELKKYE
ncbi:MAG TPA: cytochrome c-type biogenesis protein CcmH [Anaerolineae bacterium]